MPRMTSGLSVARTAIVLVALSSLVTSCFQMPRSDDARGAEGLRKSTANSESDSGDILVKVNDRAISRGEFFKLVLQQAGATTLQRQIIDAELVRQEAERLGIEIPPENVDAAVDRYIEGLAERAGGVEKFKAQFESQGLPFAEVRRDMVPQVKAELLRLAVIRQTRSVSDKELRDYYGQTYKKKRFVVRHMAFGSPLRPSDDPTRVGARKIEALDRANRAVEKVKEGHDFAEIAKVESDDEMTAGNGGLLPAIAEDGPMPAEFKEVIFALEPGQVSQPVMNPQREVIGFHIFQLVEVLGSESFVDCRDKMRKELLERDPEPREIPELISRLRRQAKIEWAGE